MRDPENIVSVHQCPSVVTLFSADEGACRMAARPRRRPGRRMPILPRIAPMTLLLAGLAASPPEGPKTSLRFEVRAADGLLDGPRDGRLFVILGRDDRREPRF